MVRNRGVRFMKKLIQLLLVFAILLCLGGCKKQEDEGMVKTVKVKDMEMDYVKFGSGEEVFIILPGLSIKSVMESAEAVAGAYSDFAEKYTVYLFDRRKNAPEGYTVKDMADDTVKAMKKLKIKNADFFGASQGGMMCLYIGLDYPQMVNKMILGSSFSRENETSKAVMSNWIKLAEEKKLDQLVEEMISAIYSQATLDAYHDYLVEANSNITDYELKQFLIMANGCEGFDVYDRLPELKCDVLVLGSEEDKVLTGQASVEMAEKLGCQYYMYQGFGHGVYDEAPDYKERMLQFLNK